MTSTRQGLERPRDFSRNNSEYGSVLCKTCTNTRDLSTLRVHTAYSAGYSQPHPITERRRVWQLLHRWFSPTPVDQTEEFPFDHVQTLVRERIMGLTIPVQYGGGGRPVLDAVLVIEQIARACGTTARLVVSATG